MDGVLRSNSKNSKYAINEADDNAGTKHEISV